MQPVGILNLISNTNQWLSQRQGAIAQNVANANTPGYRSVDVRAFSDVLESPELSLSMSHAHHMGADNAVSGGLEFQPVDSDVVNHSANTVSLEAEMLKAGEVSERFALGTSIFKSFHRMIISSAR